jgi:preprotein translocase subunit SecB
VVELVYAGLFALENFPKDKLEAICLVECPRILFPFARRIIADTTREGAFPPLLLDPIDFGRLYRNNRDSGTPAKK